MADINGIEGCETAARLELEEEEASQAERLEEQMDVSNEVIYLLNKQQQAMDTEDVIAELIAIERVDRLKLVGREISRRTLIESERFVPVHLRKSAIAKGLSEERIEVESAKKLRSKNSVDTSIDEVTMESQQKVNKEETRNTWQATKSFLPNVESQEDDIGMGGLVNPLTRPAPRKKAKTEIMGPKKTKTPPTTAVSQPQHPPPAEQESYQDYESLPALAGSNDVVLNTRRGKTSQPVVMDTHKRVTPLPQIATKKAPVIRDKGAQRRNVLQALQAIDSDDDD